MTATAAARTEAQANPSTEASRPVAPRAGRGRATDNPLLVRIETAVDFEATAVMAAEGFGLPPGSFKPDRLRWLYDEAFSNGSTVLGLYAQERKVGQVVLLHQTVCLGGRLESAVALVDLFILKAFRSRQAMADLYGAVERFCRDASIRFILAVPNPNGARVNVRYLALKDFFKLDIRGGLCVPWRGAGVTVSATIDHLGKEAATTLFSRFLPSEVSGLFWTPSSLWARLQGTEAEYGVHASEDLLLISSPRTTRRVSHTLICAMLTRPGAPVRRGDVRKLARAACALHRRSLFIYAGINQDVPLPGLTLPERFRPSPMVVQARDFQVSGDAAEFSRFELIDFDFA